MADKLIIVESPAKANSAKRAVPPVGMRAEVKLIAPGHMIPTARPLIIQPVRLMRGTEAKDAVKYATKQRAPAPSIYADKSSFSPFLPYQSRPSPMQNAKPQGPAKSPIDLSTPKDSSAKADVHCAIVASEAPAAIIRIRKSTHTFSILHNGFNGAKSKIDNVIERNQSP